MKAVDRRGSSAVVLAVGRRMIARRGLTAGALRWGVAALAAAFLGLSALALLGKLLPAEAATPALLPLPGSATALLVCVGAAVLLAAIVGGRLGLLRARGCWPEIWDRACALPQTVSTIASVAELTPPSPWCGALIEDAANLPMPGRGPLRQALPWRLRSPVATLLIALLLGAGTMSLPRRSPGQTRGPEAASTEPLLAALDALAGPPGAAGSGTLPALDVGELRGALRSGEDAAPHLHQAADALEVWLAGLRTEARIREQAAAALDAVAEGAPLARWLRSGISPAELPPLPPAELARLAASAARALEGAGGDRRALEGAAAWLRAWAAGEVSVPPPALAALAPRHHEGSFALELLRAAGSGMPASLIEADLAEGGSTGALREATGEDTPPESGGNREEAPGGVEPLRIDHGTPLGAGEVLAQGPLGASAAGAEPLWASVLARPEIEPRWIGVIERYRRIHSREQSPGGAR
ncbi:MAG: hypothetical protein ACE5GW_13210 [Planctomycetota bacterium]